MRRIDTWVKAPRLWEIWSTLPPNRAFMWSCHRVQILHANAHGLDVEPRFASMADCASAKHRPRGSGTQSGELLRDTVGKTWCAGRAARTARGRGIS